jgi:hypothetical protein
VEPAGPVFGNLFQKKWSKLEQIGNSFIHELKYIVHDAEGIKDTFLTTGHSQLDYAIALIQPP